MAYPLPMLDAGASYSFTVTPNVSGAIVDGETSDQVSVVVAGTHRTPVPGEQTYHTENLSFSASDTSGVWSYSYGNYGSVVDDSTVRAPWDCSITATLSGRITTASSLSFQWSASSYYGNGADALSVVFTDAQGNETTIWSISNSANISRQNVNLSLSSLAGQGGKIRISYSHSGSAYTASSYGGFIYAPTITNVQIPVVPAVAWDTVAMSDLGTPEILSISNVMNGVAVSPIREGLYRECRYGTTTEVDVVCSGHVTNLCAHSSHLALVGEPQVTTRKIGPHTFRVSVDASGIGEARSRSRLVLTLEATDENGTKVYNDLSLRFSEEDEPPPVEPLAVATSTLPSATVGETYSVALEATGGVEPYTWSTAFSGYEESREANSFSAIGTAQGWQDDDRYWELQLPFAFPFFSSAYRSVRVSSNGTLSFGDSRPGYASSSTILSTNAMIAALWKDLNTSSGDIYVERASDHVTIRWDGAYYSPSTSVSFSATLCADGTIRLRYGDGNANGGMIGISSGTGERWSIDWIEISQYINSSMANAQDIVFTPQPALPSGLSLSSAGVLSGTPATHGEESVAVFVTDCEGTRVGRTLNLTVNPAPPGITTSALPAATAGEPYSVTLEADGGVGPYVWSAAAADGHDESRAANSFSAVGTAMGWHGDDDCWELNLPFDFPFYGSTYSNVWVNSNGTLTFDGYFTSYTPDRSVLLQHPMIAVLWNDLKTNADGLDIYVSSNSTASVTIRWSGAYYNSSSTASFSATLYADGTIRLCYGEGNIGGGMIGVSPGNNIDCLVSSASESGSMNEAQDIVFAPHWALPPGLSLSSAGVLSGTPTTPGVKSATVFVTDAAGREVSRTFNITVGPPVEPLEITTDVLPPATSGVPYSVTLEATGGYGSYVWPPADSYGYDESSSANSFSVSASETAMGWRANLFDNVVSWKLDLPFDFPFYGETYSNVWVSIHGVLAFDGYFDNWYPSDGSLTARRTIAALWEDIDTSSGNIYVKSSAEAVTVRWSGVYRNTSDPVSFAATLYPDGRVRLSYGAGNINGGWIGVSYGNGQPFYTLAAECSSESSRVAMNNANDIVFTPWTPLPEGLAISTDGVLSGTPTTAGTISFHVYVMDIGPRVTEVGKTLNLTIISPTPTVTPGTDTPATYDSDAVAAAVADINANKTEYIVAPTSLANAPAAKAEYQNMFQAIPEYDANAGAYKIVTRLTANAVTALTADAAAKTEKVAGSLGEIAADAAGEQTDVPVTGAKPGFYYSISYGTSVGAINTEGARVRVGATGAITLKTPPKAANATSGFYKVNVNVTDK